MSRCSHSRQRSQSAGQGVRVAGGNLCRRQKHRPSRQARPVTRPNGSLIQQQKLFAMGHATVPVSQCRNAREHLDKLKFERRISGHGGQRSQSAGVRSLFHSIAENWNLSRCARQPFAVRCSPFVRRGRRLDAPRRWTHIYLFVLELFIKCILNINVILNIQGC